MTSIVFPKLLKTIGVKTGLSRWDWSAGETVVVLKEQCSKYCPWLDWSLSILSSSSEILVQGNCFSLPPLFLLSGYLSGHCQKAWENTTMTLSSLSYPTPTLSHGDRRSQSAKVLSLLRDKYVYRTLPLLPCAPQPPTQTFFLFFCLSCLSVPAPTSPVVLQA